MQRLFWSLLFISMSVQSQEVDRAIDLKVERFELANGLKVLLHVDPSVPLVSYHTWFRVGSRDEEPGYTGIAHLFEHMMFKGAKRYDGKTFDKLLGANGATHNAFTTRDSTAYYAVLPSTKLELIIDLESDRMENLEINQAHLDSEREVVKEERRYRVDNQPTGMLFESIYSTVFKVYPYRWPVIGWMEDLSKITVEKCREFFKSYYAPNNATIVIAGDFDADRAKNLVKKYYNHIPRQDIVRTNYPIEPEQTSERKLVVPKNVQNDHIAISYKTVPVENQDTYPLEVLANMLGSGESSRLYKRLVYQQQMASIAAAYHSSSVGPGVFTVYLALKPKVDRNLAITSAYELLWQVRNHLFSEKELQIAKNQILSDHVNQLKTINGKASSLAHNEVVLGNYEFLFKDLAKYQAVTLQDIKRVANKYLKPEQRNLVVVSSSDGKSDE